MGNTHPLSFPAMLSRRFNTSFEVLKFTMKIKTRRDAAMPQQPDSRQGIQGKTGTLHEQFG
jgi:hypothetical protein